MTAVVQDKNNRARSVAAGVVSGAGSQPVFEKPHSDESAPSRTGASWPQPGQGSSGGGCALRVVPGAEAHTKGVTGLTGHNDVVGRWSESFICPLLDRQSTAFQEAGLGTGTVCWKAASLLEQSV